MTTTDYAKAHGMSVVEVRQKCASGEIPAVQEGTDWNIQVEGEPVATPEEVLEQVEDIPVSGPEAEAATVMSQSMQEERAKQQREFIAQVVKLSVNGILSGEILGSIPREHLPKNFEILQLDHEASGWNISLLAEMLDVLKEEEILTDKEANTFMEAFIELFNKNFITWRLWKENVAKFIEKFVTNTKITKKVSASTIKSWSNFEDWVRYSLINTNPIRGFVVETYFRPNQDQ